MKTNLANQICGALIEAFVPQLHFSATCKDFIWESYLKYVEETIMPLIEGEENEN